MQNQITVRNQAALAMPSAPSNISIFDSGAFCQMLAIADAVSSSSLIPDALKGKSPEEARANCLLVIEQAARWDISPFAAMQCASVVRGRLMWEGKLVHGVLEQKLGIRLAYAYAGSGKGRTVTVSGKFSDEVDARTISGTVEQWATTGTGSPWADPANHDRQLAYRGAREWARRHAPGVMLGVITEDEELADGSSKPRGRRSPGVYREERETREATPIESAPQETSVEPQPSEQPAVTDAAPEEATGSIEPATYSAIVEAVKKLKLDDGKLKAAVLWASGNRHNQAWQCNETQGKKLLGFLGKKLGRDLVAELEGGAA